MLDWFEGLTDFQSERFCDVSVTFVHALFNPIEFLESATLAHSLFMFEVREDSETRSG